jgi:hypothetical protein
MGYQNVSHLALLPNLNVMAIRNDWLGTSWRKKGREGGIYEQLLMVIDIVWINNEFHGDQMRGVGFG